MSLTLALLVGWQLLKVILIGSSIGHHAYIVTGEGGWQIDVVVPSLWFQHCLSILSVIIQEDFQVSFVMLRIHLRTDEHAIELDTDLLEQGVSQVVYRKQIIGCSHIISIIFLQESVPVQSNCKRDHVTFLRVYLKSTELMPAVEVWMGTIW